MVKLRCSKPCKDGDGPPFCKIRKCCHKRDLMVVGNVKRLKVART
jgi:hypothetical protein